MNIRIQVMANQARQAIQQVQGDISKLGTAQAAGSARTAGATAGIDAMSRSLIKSGSQMQWAGRQMTYNFTLPIIAATAAGVKFANDNNKAMVELVKVYGDGTMATSQIRSETDALGRSFEAMSEIYGVARADVINIGAAWAAAGSSGKALAIQTKVTMDAMVLGNLDAATATKSLIAIQAQYGQTTEQLQYSLAQLNAVENQTGTSMGDLIQSMARSSGVAKAAGIDVAHLAALTAALVPAAGSASTAGNALKTVISRLLSPTKDAQDLLHAMGITLSDTSWKSADASTRLQILSKHFEGLSDAQKQVVSSAIASRLQLNKFDVLMDALSHNTSYYYQALKAVGDGLDANAARTKVMAIYTSELNTVLDSSPNKFARMKVMLENTLADAIQPMLPSITALGMAIASIAKSFGELPVNVQKDIIVFALMLAVVGPIITKLGALKTLIGYLTLAFIKLTEPLIWFVKLMWDAVAAVAGFVLEQAIAGLELLGKGFLSVAGIIAGPLMTAITVSAAFMGEALMGMWAAVRTSWLIGLTSLSSLSLGAFAVLSVGVQATFVDMWAALRVQMIFGQGLLMRSLRAFLNVFVLAWDYITIAVEAIMTAFGPTLRTLWTTIMLTLEVVTVEIGGALARAWSMVMTTIETVLVAGARALGIAYRAALVGLEIITAELGAGIAGIWRALQAAMVTIQVAGGALLRGAAVVGMAMFEGALVAGAAIAGGIWRALQATLAGIQVAGSAVLAAVTSVGGTILTAAWAGIGMAVSGVWELATGGLVKIAKIAWFNIVMGAKLLGPELIAALASPWVLGAAAVAGILFLFRDKLKGIWDNIVKFFQNMAGAIVQAFGLLPKGVQGAIMAVVNMVKTAAMEIYKWFSYINPFAHHSPSLVENVTNGMNVVTAQFGRLTDIKGPIDSAYVSIKQFKDAALDLAKGYDSIKTANEVADLTKAGASPALIAGYVKLAAQLANLKNIQDEYDGAMKAQQSVVDGWQKALDAANKELNTQKNTLTDLKNVAQGYSDQITLLKNDLSNLTSAPIEGMGAFDDAIFSNQQAQKALQLQIAQLQQTGSGAFASLTDEAAALQGQIETVMGSKNDARKAGAGSEITSRYDDQIKALQAQKRALGTAAGAGADSVGNLQKQLDDLGKKANILDLQKSLQFDGLTRQIDKTANSMQELPFQTIMDGVVKDKSGIAALTAQFDAANAAVDAQQKVVDSAQKSVDTAQAGYDAASQSLSDLKSQYDQVTQAIQDMSQAMQTAHDAATNLTQAKEKQLSPTMQNFADAAGGNFPDVGGTASVGREGIAGDQSASIDTWTKDLQKKMGSAMGGFDMFGPFKDMWNGFVKWWNKNALPWIKKLSAPFTHLFDGVDLGGSFSNLFSGIDFKGTLSKAWKILTSWWSTLWDIGSFLWDLIGGDVKNVLGQLGDFFKKIGSSLGELFSGIKERIGPFLDALHNIIEVSKPVIEFFAGIFVVAFKAAFDLLVNIIKPILDFIAASFKNFVDFFLGILDIFIGLFTGDWHRFWQGIKEVLGAIWDEIVAVVSVALGLLWAPIQTVLGWIGDLFSWLWKDAIKPIIGWIVDGWNMLGSAFSWVWDNILHPYINAWVSVFTWLWDNVLSPVIGWIVDGWNMLGKAFGWAYDHLIKPIFDAFGSIINGIRDTFDNVVTAVKGIWDKLIDVFKAPIKIVFDFVNGNMIDPVNSLLSHFPGGLKIGHLPELADGGLLRGPGTGRSDSILAVDKAGIPVARVSNGEFVVNEKSTRENFELIKAINDANGKLPAFQNGGDIGGVFDGVGNAASWVWDKTKDAASWVGEKVSDLIAKGGRYAAEHLLKPLAEAAKNMIPGDTVTSQVLRGSIDNLYNAVAGKGDQLDAERKNGSGNPGGTISGGGSGTTQIDRMFSFIRQTFPRANLNSSYRPGDPGYHGMGKAIDLGEQGFAGGDGRPYLASMNQWLYDHVGHIAELIYDGVGDTRPDIKNGANHVYDAATSAQHHNHVHWAMDQFDTGGLMRSGTAGVNMSGYTERVLSPAQTQNFERLVTILDRVDLMRLDARLNGSETTSQPVVYNNSGDTVTININGDLSFPSIKGSGDTGTFITNLKDMAGGTRR